MALFVNSNVVKLTVIKFVSDTRLAIVVLNSFIIEVYYFKFTLKLFFFHCLYVIFMNNSHFEVSKTLKYTGVPKFGRHTLENFHDMTDFSKFFDEIELLIHTFSKICEIS